MKFPLIGFLIFSAVAASTVADSSLRGNQVNEKDSSSFKRKSSLRTLNDELILDLPNQNRGLGTGNKPHFESDDYDDDKYEYYGSSGKGKGKGYKKDKKSYGKGGFGKGKGGFGKGNKGDKSAKSYKVRSDFLNGFASLMDFSPGSFLLYTN